MKLHLQSQMENLMDIFSFKNDEAKGRTIYLFTLLLNSVYNVFISGLFYTGFLTMYDISITGAGIVTFIPFIGSLFSIFSSRILSRFKRRKFILTASKLYFYAMYIVATTLMPTFVTDPQARLIWFCVIIFLAYALYAPFSPGITLLFYRFFPADNEKRSRFLLLQQAFTSIMSSVTMILGSLLTDAVSGSPFQKELILGFRYFAFILVLLELAIQLCVKEYPYKDEPKLKLAKVFTEPFRHKKFLYCMLVMFAWNWIANVNNGLWSYYLLNHMKFSYTLINGMSVMYTVTFLLLSGFWRKILRKYSWIKTFALGLLLWLPTEPLFFMMSPERAYLFVPLSQTQNILNVGINLAYANILYMNLPEENSTAHLAFNTLGCNLFAFLGLVTGTFISSISGDQTMMFLGQEIYSVRLLCLVRLVSIGILGLVLLIKWRAFTPDHEIAEVEEASLRRKQQRSMRRNLQKG